MPTVDQRQPEPTWFKSSYSGGNATECVEASFMPSGVLIRDSKRQDGPRLSVSAEAWHRFLTARTSAGDRFRHQGLPHHSAVSVPCPEHPDTLDGLVHRRTEPALRGAPCLDSEYC
ncbi:DUF397 domain-containing protein [Streptomyces sp. CA-251251]|uniref:DUF397 domain-containing protein n=1 Tax=Streptomyces sp. CA-251251 TaxID=3240063 RepID=UPI003D8E38B0